jgi:hypothetical protein
LNHLVDEVRTSEWLSVAAGLRSAAIIVVPRTQAQALPSKWSARGLASRVLSRHEAIQIRTFVGKMPTLKPGDDIHLVTREQRLQELNSIWRSADLVEIASWLGYPPCCSASLATVTAKRRCLDNTWAMVDDPTSIFEENGARIAEIEGSPINPLLSALGLRATPHRPCSFHCRETQRLAEAYGKLMAEASHEPYQGALAEVLGWPVEWSSLHGIIEVVLPILKLCYDGDATASAYKIRLTGGAPPDQAASGLQFPHRPADRTRE